jgi:hypothetical protein
MPYGEKRPNPALFIPLGMADVPKSLYRRYLEVSEATFQAPLQNHTASEIQHYKPILNFSSPHKCFEGCLPCHILQHLARPNPASEPLTPLSLCCQGVPKTSRLGRYGAHSGRSLSRCTGKTMTAENDFPSGKDVVIKVPYMGRIAFANG